MKQWDAEWGRIGKEGHMWWLGSARKNWEATMGDRVWMWFGECFSPSLVTLLRASFSQTHPSDIVLRTRSSDADV